MDAKKVTSSLLIITLLVEIGFDGAGAIEALDVLLARTCMPVCMVEDGATIPVCLKSCEEASEIVSRNPAFLLGLRLNSSRSSHADKHA
ncbi:hypothetical protein SADUNF_Sadunf04G0153600 [Salix dunnii]|uniref:Uncharacterized protein n=1 Tax=Salix dunnii TaxID=1413687 RepID=A0A835KCR0_9ROSI|nr:hypothetical protein SADUNF_Sadunf04G0153600 [Salix dunnii]